MAWVKTTGSNPSLPAVVKYVCDTEADIKNLPTNIAPASALCVGSGNEFFPTEPNGLFRLFGEGTAAKCDTPTITPSAGAKVLPFNATLGTETPTAEIYYTVDGSTPDANKTLYTEPFAVESALTVKAIAIAAGYSNSDVASAAYTQVVVGTPTADPAAGAVAVDTPILLSCATEGAAIYYTTDGSAPNATKTLYDAETPPTVPIGGVTIKAIGIKTGYANSAVLTATYTIAE